MPITRRSALLGGAAFLATGPAAEAQDGVMRRPMNWQERQNRLTVRQRFDFSCGGAALATILTHYFSRPTREEDVILKFRIRYPTKEAWIDRAREGFSFDDIIFAAEKLGFRGQGALVPFEALEKLSGPVIVHLDKKIVEHFAVLRSLKDGRAYLSDPMAGQRTMLDDAFKAEYTGRALAIWDPKKPLPANARLDTIVDGLSARESFNMIRGVTDVHPPYR
jgi:uncharacterized protein